MTEGSNESRLKSIILKRNKSIPVLEEVNWLILRLFVVFIALLGCGGEYYPKPRGYLRIDLPEKIYQKYDSLAPYAFEYPEYSKILSDRNDREMYWMDIYMPAFKGKIHLSYKAVNNNLNNYVEDARTLVMKHVPKADAIIQKQFIFPDRKVFGIIYTIEGTNAASPVQFYATDSSNHFLRGALYFNVLPNNDSLAPVIDFIYTDIEKMLETLYWK
ncbi:MAG: gliding motility lipoprotein GldD [Bacteroidales bacterium]|nr:gliding motility lipoprotein GldD [Bacteroidales bacterium]